MNYSQDWQLENSYSDLPEQFFTKINPVPVSYPKLLLINGELAKFLGIDIDLDDKAALANLFSGNALPKNANPIAPITGYLTPQQIEIYFSLFKDEKYLQIKSQDDFKKFLDDFESSFKS